MTFSKQIALVCLCAWNNVPLDNAAIEKYTNETWGSASFAAWERVANALFNFYETKQREAKDE